METCNHEVTYVSFDYFKVCKQCGLELEQYLDFNPEIVHGEYYQRFVYKPPKRITIKILKNSGLDLLESHARQIENQFKRVVKGKITRGKVMRGLIAVCYYHVAQTNNLLVPKNFKQLLGTTDQHYENAFKKYREAEL